MTKEKVLHDPIAYKKRITDVEFASPRKEQTTTGRFMAAGSDYGVGFKTPVGSMKARSIEEGPIPYGSVCFTPDEAIR